jgi:hypothetical protein
MYYNLNCMVNSSRCFREQSRTEIISGGYGSLSGTEAHHGNILRYDSATSSTSLSVLHQSHYGSASSLVSQQPSNVSQQYGNLQPLHLVPSGNANQPLNTLIPQQQPHYGSVSNITTTCYGSPVQQQYSCSSNNITQHGSTSNISMTYPTAASRHFSSDSNSALMQLGKSNIHNAFPTTSSTFLHQNETELLVKEIAMLNFNQMWNQTTSKAKPGESLNYQPSASPPLVPHSSNLNGNVTSLSCQQMCPVGGNSLTSVSAGFSSFSTVSSSIQGLDSVRSTVMQGTRISGVPAEKHFPSSSSSQIQQQGFSPGEQVAGLHI